MGSVVALAGLGVGLVACPPKDGANPKESGLTPVDSSRVEVDAGQRQKPIAGELIHIGAGAFRAGSLPGQLARDPGLEPRNYEVELGPYQIDRLPFPNDPDRPPLTGITRREAERLCAAKGQRLCTELEWERACKGPTNDLFAGGAAWDPKCAQEPHACSSGFDVLAMGGALREWTASNRRRPESAGPWQAIVRGAAATAEIGAHRCGFRRGLDPGTQATDLGARCCKGPPNAAVVPEPQLGPAFRMLSLGTDRLTRLLALHPRTERLARDVRLFRDPDSAETVIDRGPGDRKGFLFTGSPLVWCPDVGTEILVVTGRSGATSAWVLAYWVMARDEYQLAASFIMSNEPGPVVLAYSDSIRPRLHFSSCWGCLGETGKVLFRKPESVVILQP
ncbi:formylglycine-generating enzyme family protein [Myxococcota bacterium]